MEEWEMNNTKVTQMSLKFLMKSDPAKKSWSGSVPSAVLDQNYWWWWTSSYMSLWISQGCKNATETRFCFAWFDRTLKKWVFKLICLCKSNKVLFMVMTRVFCSLLLHIFCCWEFETQIFPSDFRVLSCVRWTGSPTCISIFNQFCGNCLPFQITKNPCPH